MKNYVQPGQTITLPAPYALAPGDGFLVGVLFGVASNRASYGRDVEAVTVGVFDLKKTASALSVGDAVYWDASAKRVTGDDDDGANQRIGAAVADAGSSAATARVLLSGYSG